MTLPRRGAVIAGLAAALLAVAGGWVAGRAVLDPPDDRAQPARPAPAGFSTLRDPSTGLSIGLPPGWRQRLPGDPEVRLAAARGQEAALLVRSVDLRFAVAPGDVGAMKELTDRLVGRQDGVEVVAGAERLQLGGLPGFYYLYTFDRGAERARGAHGHYFLFDGDRMVTLVLQATPAERFAALSGLFDRIAATFRARG